MNHNPNAEKSRSQCDQIRALLQAGVRLTPADARTACLCDRLGARIYDLKKEGLQIRRDWHTTSNGKRVAAYRLATPDEIYHGERAAASEKTSESQPAPATA